MDLWGRVPLGVLLTRPCCYIGYDRHVISPLEFKTGQFLIFHSIYTYVLKKKKSLLCVAGVSPVWTLTGGFD